MSPKQWLALLCFFVSYLFFGASVFYHIEQGRELERRGQQRQQRYELHGTHTHARERARCDKNRSSVMI